MSIQTELTRITNAKAAIKAAIEGKGVTVPDSTMLDGMAALIDSIEAGGGYIVETHVVTFAETVTGAEGSTVELCDTAIQNPLALGMVTYADGATGDTNVPVLAFGVSNLLSRTTSTSGYACGTSDSSYSTTSKGYVMLYRQQAGTFNSEFSNGLFIENGKLKWRNKYGIGYGVGTAKFPAGARYIFFILGASA